VLPDGSFFPPRHCAFSWGRASAPTGVAPEALEECVHSYKVFSQRASGVRGVCFNWPRRYFSRPRWWMRAYRHLPTFGRVPCYQGILMAVPDKNVSLHMYHGGSKPMRRPSWLSTPKAHDGRSQNLVQILVFCFLFAVFFSHLPI
jgi:hypothetical protein